MERLTKGIIGLMEIYIRPNTKRCKTSANYFNSQGTRDQNDARELNYILTTERKCINTQRGDQSREETPGTQYQDTDGQEVTDEREEN